MTRLQFPLFHSHIDLAHQIWSRVISLGDIVVDATCGNGHDTLFLAKKTLTHDSGRVYALDLQETALESSRKKLETELSPELSQRVIFLQQCHSHFPEEIHEQKARLFVYNLGYLPGGDKSKTTMTQTTLSSIDEAKKCLLPGGLISITCYPGHPEGEIEQKTILDHVSQWDLSEWSCCHHQWINRNHAPSLLLIQKGNTA